MFQTLSLRDPAHPVLPSLQQWWPRAEIARRHEAAQAHLFSFPGTQGPLANSYRGLPKGCFDTLTQMWSLRDDAVRLKHLLRAALLFQAVRSSRGSPSHVFYGATQLPPSAELLACYTESLAQAGCPEPWHYSCTEVLPEYSYFGRNNPRASPFRGKDLRTSEALLASLDESLEHRLAEWAPVNLIFDEVGDSALCDRLMQKRKILQDAHAQWMAKNVIKAEAAARQQAALRAKHPRFGEWPPTPEELTALAWQMPLWDVGQLFGVSDVAVKKACKARNIETPPRGFWLAYQRRKAGPAPYKRPAA